MMCSLLPELLLKWSMPLLLWSKESRPRRDVLVASVHMFPCMEWRGGEFFRLRKYPHPSFTGVYSAQSTLVLCYPVLLSFRTSVSLQYTGVSSSRQFMPRKYLTQLTGSVIKSPSHWQRRLGFSHHVSGKEHILARLKINDLIAPVTFIANVGKKTLTHVRNVMDMRKDQDLRRRDRGRHHCTHIFLVLITKKYFCQ
jgi:hypothetical protein